MSHVHRSVCVTLGACVTLMPPSIAAAQERAQADVQIQAFTVQINKSRTVSPTPLPPGVVLNLTVFSNNDDTAIASRVLVFLPPESQILTVPTGCMPSTAGTGSNGTWHAMLACDLGDLPVNGSRNIVFAASIPPAFILKRYGAFAYSETPDPFTPNNYAERTIP